jgi:hypothetical protein
VHATDDHLIGKKIAGISIPPTDALPFANLVTLEIAPKQIPTEIATARHRIAWASLKPSD